MEPRPPDITVNHAPLKAGAHFLKEGDRIRDPERG
jgi:hypothetical protein